MLLKSSCTDTSGRVEFDLTTTTYIPYMRIIQLERNYKFVREQVQKPAVSRFTSQCHSWCFTQWRRPLIWTFFTFKGSGAEGEISLEQSIGNSSQRVVQWAQKAYAYVW